MNLNYCFGKLQRGMSHKRDLYIAMLIISSTLLLSSTDAWVCMEEYESCNY